MKDKERRHISLIKELSHLMAQKELCAYYKAATSLDVNFYAMLSISKKWRHEINSINCNHKDDCNII